MDALRPEFENKIVAPGDLASRLTQLPRPLVFTNGCFDILHRGHVTLLGQARALGAAMVVAINSDASVKRLGKGDDRPVNTLADRLAVIAALECVSLRQDKLIILLGNFSSSNSLAKDGNGFRRHAGI